MSKLKRCTLGGILFVTVTGTLAHFVYEWSGNNFIAGLFFPVSESVWEHMKLGFFPMLAYSCYMNRKLKEDYPCVTTALLFGTLVSAFLIPVIFYTYSGILGQNYLALDIGTFVLSVVLAFGAVYRLTLTSRLKACWLKSGTRLLGLLVLLLMVCFWVFTCYPPPLGIFRSPVV